MDIIKILLFDVHTQRCNEYAGIFNDYEDILILDVFHDYTDIIGSSAIEYADLLLLNPSTMEENINKWFELFFSFNQKLSIIILSKSDAPSLVADSLRAGAQGYLKLPLTTDRIIDAVRTVASGGSALCPQITRQVLSSFRKYKPVHINDKITKQEIEILNLMVSGKTTKEIADRMSLSIEGIKYHLRKIYGKLDVKNRIEAVYMSQKLGVVSNFIYDN